MDVVRGRRIRRFVGVHSCGAQAKVEMRAGLIAFVEEFACACAGSGSVTEVKGTIAGV